MAAPTMELTTPAAPTAAGAPPAPRLPRAAALRGPAVLLGIPVLGYAASAALSFRLLQSLRGRGVAPGAIRALAGMLAATPWVYALFVRPRLLRWGATDEEACRSLPGDEVVPEPVMATTRAITIDAPVAAVWSWLAQIGQGRGGFYSYDWLENLAGCDIHSADRILTEFQRPQIGDSVNLAPGVGLAVAAVEPGRLLLLRPPVPQPHETAAIDKVTPGAAFDASWAFILAARDDRTTRLFVRFRVTGRPRALTAFLCRVLLEPEHFVMERSMLRGLKRRAEAAQHPRPD